MEAVLSPGGASQWWGGLKDYSSGSVSRLTGEGGGGATYLYPPRAPPCTTQRQRKLFVALHTPVAEGQRGRGGAGRGDELKGLPCVN